MEQVNVTSIPMANPTDKPDAAAMALTGDIKRDMQNVAKELGIQLDANGNIADVQTPKVEETQAPPAPVPHVVESTKVERPVEVPQKFQNQDGTPNIEKIEKSTKSAEEMIAYFKAKEREAQQLQNRVNNPPPQPIPQATVPQSTQLTPLEYQMAQDLLNEAAAQGYALDQRLAVAQARVMARGLEAKHAAELHATEDIRRELGETRLNVELQELMDKDESLLTPAVADRLIQIKQEQNLRSFRDAYIRYLGETQFAKHTGQVKTPTPTGATVKAPATPVGPVSRVQKVVDITNPHSLTTEQLEAEARKMFPGIQIR